MTPYKTDAAPERQGREELVARPVQVRDQRRLDEFEVARELVVVPPSFGLRGRRRLLAEGLRGRLQFERAAVREEARRHRPERRARGLDRGVVVGRRRGPPRVVRDEARLKSY